MAAIVASNFAVAAPAKVAARKISSRRAALPGTCKCETHRLGETNNFIRASRTRRGRAETPETRGALDVSGFASDSRTWTDRRPPTPRSITVKRSVSVKAVRKQQVVARCVRQIENPSPCDFRRAIARVDARSERGRAGTRARDRDRLGTRLALAPADAEASDRARAAAAAATSTRTPPRFRPIARFRDERRTMFDANKTLTFLFPLFETEPKTAPSRRR